MKTNTFKRKPSFLILFFYNAFLFFGINGVVDQDISWSKGYIVYFQETGIQAIYSGMIFIVIAIIFLYQYLWSCYFSIPFSENIRPITYTSLIIHFIFIVNLALGKNLTALHFDIMLLLANAAIMIFIHKVILSEINNDI